MLASLSNIATLGYGPTTRQLITSVSRSKSIAGLRRTKSASSPPAVHFYSGDVRGAFADLPPASQVPTSPVPLAPLAEEAPTPPPSPPPASTASADLLLPACEADPESAVPLATTDRPLSTLLSHFSRRATQCMSSFERMDDAPACVTSSPGSGVQVVEERSDEPTEAERAWVRRSMAVEIEEVERVVMEAVEERGVAEVRAGPEVGTTFFDSMEMVSWLPSAGLAAEVADVFSAVLLVLRKCGRRLQRRRRCVPVHRSRQVNSDDAG